MKLIGKDTALGCNALFVGATQCLKRKLQIKKDNTREDKIIPQ